MTSARPKVAADELPQPKRPSRRLHRLAARLRWSSFKRWAFADSGPLTRVIFRWLLPVLYLPWAVFWLAVIVLYIVFLPTIAVFSSIGRKR